MTLCSCLVWGGQGLVKGTEFCLNPYFLADWRSELTGCRSTLENKSKDF